MPQVVVRRRQALWHSCATEETDYPPGDTEMGSGEGAGIQTRGWRAGLEEVSQDLEHLRRVDDDGDDLHGAVTARAAQGAPAVRFAATLSARKRACRARAAAWEIRLIDFLDQAGPCGAALFG